MTGTSRERALRARARGRVLELGPGVDLDALAARGERFDTVVSIGALAEAPDPIEELRRVERVLADDGELLLLEPTSTPGAAGALHQVGARLRRGRPLADIPAVVRAAGLSLADCDRIWTHRGVLVEGVAFRTIFPARTGVGP